MEGNVFLWRIRGNEGLISGEVRESRLSGTHGFGEFKKNGL